LKEYNVVAVSVSYDYVDVNFAEEPSETTLRNIQTLLKAEKYEKVEVSLFEL